MQSARLFSCQNHRFPSSSLWVCVTKICPHLQRQPLPLWINSFACMCSGCNYSRSFILTALFNDPIKCVNTRARLCATCGDPHILCADSLYETTLDLFGYKLHKTFPWFWLKNMDFGHLHMSRSFKLCNISVLCLKCWRFFANCGAAPMRCH